MARPKNLRPALTRHKDGRWRAWVNGRFIHIAAADAPQREVERRYALLLMRLAGDPFYGKRLSSGVLFAELVKMYLTSDEAPRSVGQRFLFVQVARLLKQAFAEIPDCMSYDGAAQREFKAWILAQRVKDRETKKPVPRWNITSVNKFLRAVVRLLKFAASRKLAKGDLVLEVSLVKGARKGDAPPPRETVAADPKSIPKLLKTLSPTLKAMLTLQRETGMRPTEVCKLRPRDVLQKGRRFVKGHGVIDCKKTRCSWIIYDEHKTDWSGDARPVALTPRAMKAIRPFLKRPADHYCFVPKETEGAHSAKLPSYTEDSYRLALRRASERAGIDRVTPYAIRFLKAVEVDEAEGTDGVMARLGHKSVRMSRHYAKRNIMLAAKLARAGK